MKRILIILSCGGVLFAFAPAEAREPSDLEQYYLELVNRARANPNGEVRRLAGKVWGDEGSPVPATLNEGLPANTITPSAKPPLAFDPLLIDAATDYTELLLDTEQFSHTANGTSSSRMTAAGYIFTAPSASGENLAATASTGPHPVDKDRVDRHHEGLFIDRNVAGRGHRINLMVATFREVGIAISADVDGVSRFGVGFNEVISTQNFATSAGRVFLTGVIYDDGNSNGFYDPGESAGVRPLSVETLTGAIVSSGTTFASGGYSLNLSGIAAGTYILVVNNGIAAETEVQFRWNGTTNVKVDIIDPFIPFRPDGRIGSSVFSLTGFGIYSDGTSAQTVAITARKKRPVTWHANFENDGLQPDDLVINGAPGNSFFRVTYLRRSGGSFANETAAVLRGFVDLNLLSGSSVDYQIVAKPEKRALGKRTGIRVHLRATSVGDGTKVDQVNGLLVNRTKKSKR